jgi:hypothetical protein
MAETDKLSVLRVPATVRLERGMSLTPNEMRQLKQSTGRPLNELLGGDMDDMDAAPDRIQSLVWVALRRDGWELSWEQAGDVLPEFVEEPPDPSSGERSPSSPGSAGSGG